MSLSQSDIDALMGGEVAAAPSQAVSTALPPSSREPDLRRILKLNVSVTVILAERDMPIEAVLDVKVGTIIEFEVPFDADLVFHVAGHPIGIGQAVKVGENFGIRISELGTMRERVEALAGE